MENNNGNKRFRKSDIATLKWLYTVGKSERWKVLTIIIANIATAVLTIVYADFTKHIFDAAEDAIKDHSQFNKIIYYAVCFLVLIAVQILLGLIIKSQTERCRCKLDWKLKQYMLERMLEKDYAAITAYHTGELQNRIHNDVNVITDGFTNILPNAVLFITRMLCAFIYLVRVDRIFALVFVVGGIGVFLCTQFFRRTIKRLHKEVQKTEGETRSFIQETITSLLVVKAFSVEDKMNDTAEELQSVNYKARMRRRFFGITANAGISAVFSLGYVFALTFGAYQIYSGVLTYGSVAAMLGMVSQIQQPFAALSSIMPKYFAMLASCERLIEIDKLPDEAPQNAEQLDVKATYDTLQHIDFDGISFKYDRDIILDNTSLQLNKGDFAAIMGISGIGKSTLLKLLLGVFKPQEGTIALTLEGGETVPVDYRTRRLFSYVPQGNFILSGTIRDNLTFINDAATDEEIAEAIRISCADEFISALPDGLSTVIGERGIGLSEGQLQRLAIARSLLSNSPVMLLDEATSALDEQTELQFLTNLKELKNKTCIIVSHKRAALQICNKHIQIVDGKIEAEEKEEASCC